MGQRDVRPPIEPEALRLFTRNVIRDLRALEQMIADDMIETGVRRIGAEQELFLADRSWRPAPVAVELLEDIDDPRFTMELGRFNLEFNLDPIEFGGACFSQMQQELSNGLGVAREAAARRDVEVILTGILPTIRPADLSMENMSPDRRYQSLNAALVRARGSDFELRLHGPDEISITHESVMLESCNTSFQTHFQVSPDEFARVYNIAQVVAAPIIAVACNSPLLFRKRLWRETRIALFEQSVDTRLAARYVQERSGRVSFGNRWVQESVIEIYKDDLARFPVFVGAEADQDPFEELAAGRTPPLGALTVHNGTVYRWNRPCYGVNNGTAHIRIENRVLPSGPTVIDEVANAAFWFGLISAMAREIEDVTERIGFDAAKANFIAAAQLGLDAHLMWLDGHKAEASDLVRDTLLPLAERGLRDSGIRAGDIERYLGVIERRVATRNTGAEWQLRSYASLQESGSQYEALRALVGAMSKREKEHQPVHEWTPAQIDEAGDWKHNYERVGQFMTTDLFTVNANEVIDLVASVMAWRSVRHVPVEDDERRLVGLVTSRSVMRFVSERIARGAVEPVAVSAIMEPDPVTVSPNTLTINAVELMRREGVSCLPVVENERLVGIVSEHDFMSIVGHLLREDPQARKAGS
jgi:CBS domain-containing protein/gamma-glutamyl:cysteine ligase YbdK (ATP-grasp superfamily)